MQKSLNGVHVFSITAGAMVSSGLFVLPALVYLKVGSGIILAYGLASLLAIPALIAKLELATAMPKSGGTYFFIHRSMGPLFGTFSGLAAWFSLALKSAFALYGMGLLLYDILQPYTGPLPPISIALMASGLTLILGIINAMGVEEGAGIQVVMVAVLIAILAGFILLSIPKVQVSVLLEQAENSSLTQILSVTGMIFVSFGGLTKAASIAEEVRNPGKNLIYGMVGAFAVVSIIYVLSVTVTIGILTPEETIATTQPLAMAAGKGIGVWAKVVLQLAAALAFITTGNAGLMASSRTPLAMSRDHLLPAGLAHINSKSRTPVRAIFLTTFFMIVLLMTLDLEQLVKAASAMKLILFGFVLLSVIIMRESKIISYRPIYKNKLYPYIHIAGILAYILLIVDMGKIPLLITGGFAAIALLWYLIFARKLPDRDSALIQLVRRITNRKMVSSKLTGELREILFEREEIVEDRFDQLVKNAIIEDIPSHMDRNQFFQLVGEKMAARLELSSSEIAKLLEERELASSTIIASGLAVPHLVIPGTAHFDLLICRNTEGISFAEGQEPVHCCFVLAGTSDERTFHLKALVAIAQIVQSSGFMKDWERVRNIDELRDLILLTERARKGESHG